MLGRMFSSMIATMAAVGLLFLPGQGDPSKPLRFPVIQVEQAAAPAQDTVAKTEAKAEVESPVVLASSQPPITQASAYDYASRDCCDQLEKRLARAEDRITALEKRCKCGPSTSSSTVVPGTVTYGQPVYSEPVIYYDQPFFGGGGCANGQCGAGGCSNGSCGPVRTILQNQPIRQFIQR